MFGHDLGRTATLSILRVVLPFGRVTLEGYLVREGRWARLQGGWHPILCDVIWVVAMNATRWRMPSPVWLTTSSSIRTPGYHFHPIISKNNQRAIIEMLYK